MTETAPQAGKIRVPLLLSPEEAKELDDWQFTHRHRTRTAALKAMMRIAIDGSQKGSSHGEPANDQAD
jgi:hypothetical protein